MHVSAGACKRAFGPLGAGVIGSNELCALSTLIFWDRVSPCPGANQIGKAGRPVSFTFPVLGLQPRTNMSGLGDNTLESLPAAERCRVWKSSCWVLTAAGEPSVQAKRRQYKTALIMACELQSKMRDKRCPGANIQALFSVFGERKGFIMEIHNSLWVLSAGFLQRQRWSS